MTTRTLLTLGAVLLSLGGATAAWSAEQQVVNCGFGGGGDEVSRGFYVTNYQGNTLARVELAYSATIAGFFQISLTARRGAYDGPRLGETQTITTSVGISGESFAVFDFGGVPVSIGDTITFSQTYVPPAGGAMLFYDVGTGPCTSLFETEATTPPLDTVRRNTVGVIMTQYPPITLCVASDTVMCVDDAPGDQRFKVAVQFHTAQGGGISGDGQAIPLAPLGVTQGGLFWFFGAANPEMLFKIVNGCSLNGHYWVFISAGTNVGFTVTVTDASFGRVTKTYTNPDLTPASPVQDTSLNGCV